MAPRSLEEYEVTCLVWNGSNAFPSQLIVNPFPGWEFEEETWRTRTRMLPDKYKFSFGVFSEQNLKTITEKCQVNN